MFPFPHTTYYRGEIDAIKSALILYKWFGDVDTFFNNKYNEIPQPEHLSVNYFDDPSFVITYESYPTDIDIVITMLWKYKKRYYGYEIQEWSTDDLVLFHRLRCQGMNVDKVIEFIRL